MENKQYIFNASFYTKEEYSGRWEEWLHAELIPTAKQTVPDVKTEIFQVESAISDGSLVFSVQFHCQTAEELVEIEEKTTPVFSRFREFFGEKATNFNSVLKKIGKA